MDDTTSTLVTWIIGIAAALLPVLLAQRVADRARRREQQRQDALREAERGAEDRRTTLADHYAGYSALYTSARQLLTRLTDLLHAVRRQADLPAAVDAVVATRSAYLARYAEVQLTASAPVLAAAQRTNRELNAVFGMVMRLAEGAPGQGDSPDAVRAAITRLWSGSLKDMRTAMRAEWHGTPAP